MLNVMITYGKRHEYAMIVTWLILKSHNTYKPGSDMKLDWIFDQYNFLHEVCCVMYLQSTEKPIVFDTRQPAIITMDTTPHLYSGYWNVYGVYMIHVLNCLIHLILLQITGKK